MTISSGSYLTQRGHERSFERPAGEEHGGSASSQPASRAAGNIPADKITALYQFNRQLNGTNSCTHLQDIISRQATEILGASFCRVLVQRPDGAWACTAAYPDICQPPVGVRGLPEPAAAQYIFQRAARRSQPTLLRKGSSFWAIVERPMSHHAPVAALNLVPLHFNDEITGMLVLGFGGLAESQARDGDRMHLSVVFAEQAAGAMFRARTSDRLHNNRAETVRALYKTIEARDDLTGDHSAEMTRLAERIATACHCSDDEIQTIRWAGSLHDIGKIGIPDEILHRAGPLTAAEWDVMRRHPDIGADIVLMVSGLAPVAELIRYHHERYDGTGYPRGLTGGKIPLGARILAVADAYTAMMEGRSYRPPLSHQAALDELNRCAGTHFDPRVVEVFFSLYG